MYNMKRINQALLLYYIHLKKDTYLVLADRLKNVLHSLGTIVLRKATGNMFV